MEEISGFAVRLRVWSVVALVSEKQNELKPPRTGVSGVLRASGTSFTIWTLTPLKPIHYTSACCIDGVF